MGTTAKEATLEEYILEYVTDKDVQERMFYLLGKEKERIEQYKTWLERNYRRIDELEAAIISMAINLGHAEEVIRGNSL